MKDIFSKIEIESKKNRHKLDNYKKKKCILGIVDATMYLHNNKIFHLDLKPEKKSLIINYYPRICDFELSVS